MSIKDITPGLKALHALYCSLTGREITFDMPALSRWEQWTARGWTEADLRLVVGFINRKITKEERRIESLRLHNLIDTARFEDDLQDARAAGRKPKRDPERARVLQATGRDYEKWDEKAKAKPVDTAAAILERSKLAAQLKEWREKNL